MNFYVLENPDGRGCSFWEDDEIDNPDYDHPVVCKLDPLHSRRQMNYGTKRYFYEDEDARINRSYDLYEGSPFYLLARRPVIDAMRAVGLTGWVAQNVAVRYLNGDRSDDFFEIWPTGFGGIAPAAIGNIGLWHCPSCQKTKYRGNLEFSKIEPYLHHDGSDFFVTWPLTSRVLCTPRARATLKKFKSKLKFLDIAESATSMEYGDGSLHPEFSASGRSEIQRYLKLVPPFKPCN